MSQFFNGHLAYGKLPKRLFREICQAIDSPKSREMACATDREILKFAWSPSEFASASPEVVRQHYFLYTFLSKYKGLKTGVNTKDVALSSFVAAEAECRSTNERLRSALPTINDPVIHGASRRIAKLLGPYSENLLLGAEAWGPGATFEFPRTKAMLDTKMTELPITVTRECAPVLASAIASDLRWSEIILGVVPGVYSPVNILQIVEGSRIATVPKNAKTDRTIAVEPRGNMFLQKAFGNLFRRRLKSVGVDLDDQSINQDLASKAQRLGLATLDLRAASDTLSLELIYMLLPLDWALALDRVRSKAYTFDNESFTPFEKFSSMGNGYTFELESLIFWSLVAECHDLTRPHTTMRECAVYGDDLICHSETAPLLISVLSYCGLSLNFEKSFTEGNFYESCGKHYFNGEDVTPCYQKESLDSDLEIVRFFNRLHRWHMCTSNPAIDSVIIRLRKEIERGRKPHAIPRIPVWAEGDDGLVSDLAITDGYVDCLVIRTIRKEVPVNEAAHYAYQLRLIHNRKARPRNPFFEGNKALNVLPFTGNVHSRSAESRIQLRPDKRRIYA